MMENEEAPQIYESMVVMNLNMGITNYRIGRYHGTVRNVGVLFRNERNGNRIGREYPA